MIAKIALRHFLQYSPGSSFLPHSTGAVFSAALVHWKRMVSFSLTPQKGAKVAAAIPAFSETTTSDAAEELLSAEDAQTQAQQLQVGATSYLCLESKITLRFF